MKKSLLLGLGAVALLLGGVAVGTTFASSRCDSCSVLAASSESTHIVRGRIDSIWNGGAWDWDVGKTVGEWKDGKFEARLYLKPQTTLSLLSTVLGLTVPILLELDRHI